MLGCGLDALVRAGSVVSAAPLPRAFCARERRRRWRGVGGLSEGWKARTVVYDDAGGVQVGVDRNEWTRLAHRSEKSIHVHGTKSNGDGCIGVGAFIQSTSGMLPKHRAARPSPGLSQPGRKLRGAQCPFYLFLYHKLIPRQHVSSMSLVTESHRSTPPGRSRQVFHMRGVSSLLIECSQSIWPQLLDRIKQSFRTMRACNSKALFN